MKSNGVGGNIDWEKKILFLEVDFQELLLDTTENVTTIFS